MSSRALPSLRPAAPKDHAADPVARSTPSTEDSWDALGGAGTPSGMEDPATATMGDAHELVSSCDYGTQECREPATAAVSIDGLPARPLCRRHTLVLVDAIAVYADRMTLQISRLDLDDYGEPGKR